MIAGKLVDSRSRPITRFVHRAALGWRPVVPDHSTLGQANSRSSGRSAPSGSMRVDSEDVLSSDFVELYNPQPLPVDLGGFYVTDTPRASPTGTASAAESPRAKATLFTADGHAGPGHLDFRPPAVTCSACSMPRSTDRRGALRSVTSTSRRTHPTRDGIRLFLA
jgi:hypothetical protein